MEGPSLFLAADILKPFINKTVCEVSGNTKFGKERLLDKKVLDIFSWGKNLVFQFDTFAFRVHFMLFGSYTAEINGQKATGDYPVKNRPVRLQLIFKNGEVDFFSCSLKFMESEKAKDDYDYSIDIMSPEWDAKKVLKLVREFPERQICDVLLDQKIFAGVGNIIKNEVLFLMKVNPQTLIKDLTPSKLKKIVMTARSFSWQFYEWRKRFELKKHYQIYRKSVCPGCLNKVTKKWTGMGNRVSYFCLQCQPFL